MGWSAGRSKRQREGEREKQMTERARGMCAVMPPTPTEPQPPPRTEGRSAGERVSRDASANKEEATKTKQRVPTAENQRKR